MVNHLPIINWLSEEIYKPYSKRLIIAWMFGSIVYDQENANDCDVLIIIKAEYFSDLLLRSSEWRVKFKNKFGKPLHLTRLTIIEAKQCKELIKSKYLNSSILINNP